MKKVQSIIEYVLLVAIVVAAFSAMRLYVERSIQAHLKTIQDQLNNPEVIDAN